VGPSEYMVIAFEGNRFSGEIMPEIKRLKDENLIRILDALVLQRDESGVLLSFELSDMPEMEQDASDLDADLGQWFSQDDIEQIGEVIPNSSTVALLLVEHVWAEPLSGAIRRANGTLLARTYVSPELIDEVEALVGAGPSASVRAVPPSTANYEQRRAA
jgi:uncharacterized membrane protein